MQKIHDDYKHKYLVLEITDKAQENLLKDALDKYIEKIVANIESASKGKASMSADSIIERYSKELIALMNWRDRHEIIGTDTYLGDLDFYKNGVCRV